MEVYLVGALALCAVLLSLMLALARPRKPSNGGTIQRVMELENKVRELEKLLGKLK